MLRRYLPILLFLLACGPTESQPRTFNARVVHVADGDSFRVADHSGRQFEIRLSGIDAPEKGQVFASQSREALRTAAGGWSVAIEVDDVDQYGRLVARVARGSLDLGLMQLEKGAAWVYPRADKLPRSHLTRYRDAERSAKVARLGLWSEPDPVPPWIQRRNAVGASASDSTGGRSAVPDGPVIANRRSMVYHLPGCPGYEAVAGKNRIRFESKAAAERAGYRLASNCNG